MILNFHFSCRYGSGENSSIHLHHGWRPTHQIYRVQGKDYVLKHCKNLVSHTQNKCHARKHVTQKHVTQKTCHTKTCHAKTYHAKYMSRKKHTSHWLRETNCCVTCLCLSSSVICRISNRQETGSADSKPLPSLVICPPTLTGHWVYEVEKFVSKEFLKPLHYTGPPMERQRCV